jgi:putative tricarboxylic transport membrane protein
MKIGPPEYFALGIMALSLVSIASKGETMKGLMMACVGLSLSFIGPDPVSGVMDRFSFGSLTLASGIPILTVFLGLFAVVQVFTMLEEGGSIVQDVFPTFTVRDALTGFWDVLRSPLTLFRSIGIGMYIGILPALGVTTATITSYLVEKKYSADKEHFGEGAPSGLVAAEVAKGCCVVGDMIPTFTLGIPGSVTGGIIMAAFVLHGIQPGPQFLLAGPAPYVVFAGIILAQFLIVITGLPLIKYLTHITKIPNTLLAPILIVLCFVGALVERNLTFDIFYLFIFGVLGFILNRLGYSLISFVLGLILGDLIETNFHRTVGMGYGSLHLFWTRPLTIAFFGITLLFLAWPYLKVSYMRLSGKTSGKFPSTEIVPAALKIGFSEIVLLAALLLMSLGMLVESKHYPGNVKLFPNIVSYFILILIAWRLAPLILKRRQKIYDTSVKFKKPWLSKDTMSWEWSAGIFLSYCLLIYVLGFLISTTIYLLAVPLLLRYRSKFITVILAIATTISTALLARLLHVVLP